MPRNLSPTAGNHENKRDPGEKTTKTDDVLSATFQIIQGYIDSFHRGMGHDVFDHQAHCANFLLDLSASFRIDLSQSVGLFARRPSLIRITPFNFKIVYLFIKNAVSCRSTNVFLRFSIDFY